MRIIAATTFIFWSPETTHQEAAPQRHHHTASNSSPLISRSRPPLSHSHPSPAAPGVPGFDDLLLRFPLPPLLALPGARQAEDVAGVRRADEDPVLLGDGRGGAAVGDDEALHVGAHHEGEEAQAAPAVRHRHELVVHVRDHLESARGWSSKEKEARHQRKQKLKSEWMTVQSENEGIRVSLP